MAFTAAEYKKMSSDPMIAGVYAAFIENSPFIERSPIEDITGGALIVNRETTLPTTAFRGIGSEYTASEGAITPTNIPLSISGGKLKTDRALPILYGTQRQAIAMSMQAKSLARTVNTALFKGASGGDSIVGLESTVAAGQTISNGTAGLKLSVLDEALQQCEGDNRVIFMSSPMLLKFNALARTPALNGNIGIAQNEMGIPQMFYGGIPLVAAGKTAAGAEVLPFTETSTTSSIYVVSLSLEGTHLIQNGGIRNFAPVKESVASEYDIDWYVNYVIGNLNSAIRVSLITNVAITA